jgi:hypothetical protein
MLLTVTSYISGCSLSTEDTRITFCRDLTLSLLENPESLIWTGNQNRFQPSEYAAVSLQFDAKSGTSGSAVCFYAYDVIEENAMHLSQPLSAHASVPYKMELNGEPVPQSLFREAVNEQSRNILLKLLDKFFQGAGDSRSRLEA